MAQIREKGYWHKFESKGKKIYLIGVNFNTSTHRLEDYIIESLD